MPSVEWIVLLEVSSLVAVTLMTALRLALFGVTESISGLESVVAPMVNLNGEEVLDEPRLFVTQRS